MKRKIVVLLLVILESIAIKAQVKVVDAETKLPVVMAQILNANGVYLNVTNANGEIPEELTKVKDLIIQHIAYDKHNVTAEEISRGFIELTLKSINLSEVSIKGGVKDFMRIRGYFRQFTKIENGDGLMSDFEDGMLEYYVPMKNNSKVYPVTLVSRKMSMELQGDSLVKTKRDTTYSEVRSGDYNYSKLSKNMLFDNKYVSKLDLTKQVDSIRGKYSMAAIMWRSNDLMTISVDLIPDNEKRYFHVPLLKFLFGVDMCLSDMYETAIYRSNNSDKYTLSGLVGMTSKSKMRIVPSGKRIRKSLAEVQNIDKSEVQDFVADFFTEIYFTEWEYVDKQEYKTAKQNKQPASEVKLVIPTIVPPLSNDIQKILQKAE